MGFGDLILFGKPENSGNGIEISGKCLNCQFFVNDTKLCKRYSVITETWKNCKSYKKKVADK